MYTYTCFITCQHYIHFAGQAFCKAHCVKVDELGYPTKLREFLTSCGKEVTPDSYTKNMKKLVDEKIKKISQQIDAKSFNVKSSTDVQGTTYLLRKRAFKQVENFELEEDEEENCNKYSFSSLKIILFILLKGTQGVK